MFLPSKLPSRRQPVGLLDGGRFLGVERRSHLVRRPGEVRALALGGVGVLGAEEAAPRVPHLPEQVVERLLGDGAVAGLAQQLPRVQVAAGQLGVVVEHLLEVGDQPVAVGGVAVEAAAQVVVHAAGGHGVEGHLDI